MLRFDRRWIHPSWWNLLVVLPWAIGLVLAIHEWADDLMIARREKATNGIITAHEPSNHGRYGYTFSVDGKPFSGWEIPRNKELHIGQQLTVFYDPIDPTQNAITDFADLEIDSLGPVPLLLFGIGAVALFIGYRRREAAAETGEEEEEE